MKRLVVLSLSLLLFTCKSNRTVDRKEGDPTLPTPPVCTEVSGGSTGAVQIPTLRITLPASWDENWLASPAAVDLDGDGEKEIIAARHSVLYAWSSDGTLLWQTAFGQSAATSSAHGTTRMWPSPAVGDFDGDGEVDIAVAGGVDSVSDSNVAVYEHDGTLKEGWPRKFGETEVRSIAAADIDGDGVVEILVNKTSTGPATSVYEPDGSVHSGWPQVSSSCDPPAPAEPCWDFGGYNQNIGSGDVNGDGILDVISTYDAIGFGVFEGDGTPFPVASGFSDAVITAVEAYHDLSLSQQGWGTGDRSEFTDSPPVIADIDEDGNMEIVLAGDHKHSDSTDNQGVTVWVLNHDLTRPEGWLWPKDTDLPLQYGDVGNNIVDTTPSPSVADLDGVPGLEIVVPAYDGVLHAFRSNGEIFWEFSFSTSSEPFIGGSEALIADLNGDGSPEIIFTTYSSGEPGVPDTTPYLYVLNANGALLHQVEISGRGSMSAPTVSDLDGDGQLELLISLKDTLGGGEGGVQIWDLAGSKDNCILWETGRGGFLRQGYVPN